jgi:hypothetical protein
MVGVGVDFARMYAFKTQLKTVTDASAMAGAIELMRGHRAGMAPEDSALFQVPLNNIEAIGTAEVLDADVDAVEWDFATRDVVNDFNNDYTIATANAVRVVGRYTANFTFGRVFGLPSVTLVDTTVAALGGVGSQDCLKPFGVGYESMLRALYGGNLPPDGLGHTLTPDDIADLASDTLGNTVTLLNDTQDKTRVGNIAQVTTWSPTWPGTIPGGGSAYGKAVKSQTCTDKIIAPGDWIDGDPGAGQGQTENPLEEFCNNNGGTTKITRGFTCNDNPRVKLVMWDQAVANGTNARYRVKYVGVFAITQFQKQPSGPPQVSGFFTAMSSDGAFTGATGTTFKGAIVY